MKIIKNFDFTNNCYKDLIEQLEETTVELSNLYL